MNANFFNVYYTNAWTQSQMMLCADVADDITRLSSKRLFILALNRPKL